MLDIEEQGGAALAALLGVAEPETWPPEHNDADTRAWLRGIMAAHLGDTDYAGWYIVALGGLVGTCGYTGPADAAGKVEIGYAVIPGAQRRGYATRAVQLLITRAFRDPRVNVVVAHTLAAAIASQRVLHGCGFVQTDSRIDPKEGEMLEFSLQRSAIGNIDCPR